MPFNETSKGDKPEYLSSGKSSELRDDYEQQRKQRQKEKAVTHLVETGRAKTPEEAEQYLESLRDVKEAIFRLLIEHAREQAEVKVSDAPTRVLLGSGFKRTSASMETLAELDIGNIDELNPRLWELERTVGSDQSDSFRIYRENVYIASKKGEDVALEGDGSLLYLLRRLSSADVELLNREHEFARRDLVKRLRKEVEQVEAKRFVESGWDQFFQKRSHQRGT